jgi:CDP-paratose 2-epimerase
VNTRGRSVALVTGGAGFVGTNLVERLLADGKRVRILDSLGRRGSERNLRWLRARHRDRVEVELGDVRDAAAVKRAVADVSEVYHLAAQVAVTTSLDDPFDDFLVNAQGTVRLLDELRRLPEPPFVLFTSTNKVYGALPDVELVREDDRWRPADELLAQRGISERRPLDFCTPYGCSKGAADQYVLDWGKSYGIPTTVFRMSCIYGPHQHGNEDQGWVAHFLIRALEGKSVTIYGDGAQVRDVLFVSDLVEAMRRAPAAAGRAYNIGGGPDNTLSLLEFIELIREIHGTAPQLDHGDERPGDQRWYVSDTSAFRVATGWRPRTDVADGVEQLYRWLLRARTLAAVAARAR